MVSGNEARVRAALICTASLFVAVLVTSNILASKVVQIGPLTLTGAIVLFPLAYLFGDVLTEVWGYATSRIVIWSGFLANLVVVAFIAAAIALPSAPAYSGQAAYVAVLGSTPRLVAASFVAYLIGEFVNSYLMARLKVVTSGRLLWTRTIGSTVVGQGLDSLIFTSLAFVGVLPGGVVVGIILSNWVVKVGYEVAATPLTYLVVNWLKRLRGVDVFDRDTNFAPVPLRGVAQLVRGGAR
jgi:uncharacterized integral membrane protein (TIGR00697 family)